MTKYLTPAVRRCIYAVTMALVGLAVQQGYASPEMLATLGPLLLALLKVTPEEAA